MTTTTIRIGTDHQSPVPPIPNHPPSCIMAGLRAGPFRPQELRSVPAPGRTSSCSQGSRTGRSAPHAYFCAGTCHRRPCHKRDPWSSRTSSFDRRQVDSGSAREQQGGGSPSRGVPPSGGLLRSLASSPLAWCGEPCPSSSLGTPSRPSWHASPCDASCAPSSRVASSSSWRGRSCAARRAR